MAFVPIAMAVIAAVGAMASAQAQSNQAKGQQNAANYNAAVATNNATSVRQQADANEEAQRRNAAIQLGRERAAIVQSGQGLTGSAGDIYAQSTSNAELDAMNTRYNGEIRGVGLDEEGTLQSYAGVQYGKNASAAITGGYLNAGAAALSSYGSYMRSGNSLGGR